MTVNSFWFFYGLEVIICVLVGVLLYARKRVKKLPHRIYNVCLDVGLFLVIMGSVVLSHYNV